MPPAALVKTQGGICFHPFLSVSCFRSTDVTEMKVRFGKLELAFLRWAATEQGISLSETVRRAIAETMARYEEQGKYLPEPEQETVSPDNALSIRVGKEMDGSLWYETPDGFSPDLSAAVVSVLNSHAHELRRLVSPPVNKPSPHVGGDDGDTTNPEAT